MAKQWFPVRKVKRNGKWVWEVDQRINGKGPRPGYNSREEAEGVANKMRALRQKEGLAAFENSQLAKYGWTVGKATDFALDHLKFKEKSILIPLAVEKLLTASREKGLTPKYISDLNRHLTAFANAFPFKYLSEIKTDDIQAFLNNLKTKKTGEPLEPITCNTYRRDICTLFAYGSSGQRGWCLAATAEDTDLKKVVFKTPGVLEVAEMEQLIRCAAETEPKLVAGIVLGGFCAVRYEEIEKLNWSHINLNEGFIKIDADVAKISSRRSFHFKPNAFEWLKVCHKNDGCVITGNFRHEFDRVRLRCGYQASEKVREDKTLHALIKEREGQELKPWINNAFRHSAISYRAVLEPHNLAGIAFESGNSVKKIKTNYLNLVEKSQAIDWFNINPVS